MVVNLDTTNLFNGIGAAWMVGAGAVTPIPPKGVLVQHMHEANARLVLALGRFLAPSFVMESFDDLVLKETTLTYDLALSPRRAASKGYVFPDLFHSFIVNETLALVFSEMSQTDLATKHETLANADIQAILTAIHTKIAPV